MIVEQVGYLKLKDLKELKTQEKLYSLYKTHKNTIILILSTKEKNLSLFYPKRDRLPYKILEGKKIVTCELIYCSNDNTKIVTTGWNNNEQIMAYKPI